MKLPILQKNQLVNKYDRENFWSVRHEMFEGFILIAELYQANIGFGTLLKIFTKYLLCTDILIYLISRKLLRKHWRSSGLATIL